MFKPGHRRAQAFKHATMEWVDGNRSKLTMKYPAVWLWTKAHGEVLSIAFTGKGKSGCRR
jgi:Fe-S cluster assembly scaffold protein SufB